MNISEIRNFLNSYESDGVIIGIVFLSILIVGIIQLVFGKKKAKVIKTYDYLEEQNDAFTPGTSAWFTRGPGSGKPFDD